MPEIDTIGLGLFRDWQLFPIPDDLYELIQIHEFENPLNCCGLQESFLNAQDYSSSINCNL